MNKIVRLYWQHDLDLVALKMHPDFDIAYWLKRAVIAYARGDDDFVIPLPRSMPFHVELDNCNTHFVLNPEKEADVIACLNGFRTGHCNGAIKNIFRMYMEGPYLEPYYNEKMYAVKARSGTRGDADKPRAIRETPVKKTKTQANVVSRKESSAVVEHNKSIVANEKKETKSFYNPTPTKHEEIYTPEPEVKEVSVVGNADDDNQDGFDMFSAIDDMLN